MVQNYRGKKLNIFLFASDSKGKAVLENIVKRLKVDYDNKINFLFLFSNETQLQYPTMGMDTFRIDGDANSLTQLSRAENYCESLNMKLPWKPDILLIQRERWQPEQSIIKEFKEKFQSKIGVVEVNSQVVNHIESQLEMASRFRYPQQMVDFYFEGSEWTLQNRKSLLGKDWDKSFVTGNPRFDTDDLVSKTQIEEVKNKYNLDERKNIIFWGVINTSRNEALDCLHTLNENIDKTKYRIFYKPYPGEPKNEKFKNQFVGNSIKYNNNIVDDITIIYDDIDIWGLTYHSDIHFCTISSSMLFPLSMGKVIVNLHNKVNFLKYMNQPKRFLDEYNIGVEDSAKFWMSVFGVDDRNQFKRLLEGFETEKWQERNDIILNDVKEKTYNFDDDLEFIDSFEKGKKPHHLQMELMKYFDSYYDGNASERIIKILIGNFF